MSKTMSPVSCFLHIVTTVISAMRRIILNIQILQISMNQCKCHRIANKIIPSAIISSNLYISFFTIGNQLFKILNCKCTVFIIGQLIHIITACNIHSAAQFLCCINQTALQCKLLFIDATCKNACAAPASYCTNRNFIAGTQFLYLVNMSKKFLCSVIDIQFNKLQFFLFCFAERILINPSNNS